MRICPSARKSLAALLLACLLVLLIPSPAIAGGCDDPGNVGACNHRTQNSGHGSQPPPNPSGKSLTSHGPAVSQPRLDLAGWRVWLITMLVGLGR